MQTLSPADSYPLRKQTSNDERSEELLQIAVARLL
jgi:hypothetical protein